MTSVADYNNNPGNLRPKGFTYKGQIGVDDRGFAIFENKDAGRSALIQDIRAKQRQGLNNPNAFIDKYTPAMAENPEEGRDNYKIRMAQHLGLKSTTDPFPKGSEEKIADLITTIEGGEAPAPAGKEESGTKKPFEDFKPRVFTEDDEPPPPLEKTGVEKAIDFATDVGGSVVNKVVENPELPAAAGLGLIKGTLEKVLQNPEKHLVGEGEKTPQQVQSARDAARAAQTRVGEVERIASSREPIDVDSLQRQFDLRKFGNELADEDLRAAQKDLKGLPKTYVPPVEPAAADTAEQIASRTKQGASGASNWVRAMGEDIPEVLASQAENMRKDNPKGGQAIIDANAAAKQKLQSMGLGDFKLTEPGPGQLALPPQEAARLEQELAARQAQEAADQAARAQQVEAQRLAAEADLQRQRQAAEQRVEQARKSKISAGERAAEAKRQANAAQQRSAAQARSDAAKLETAQISARTAQQTAKEAAAAQPSGLTMATREAGRRFAEKAPIIGNVLGAAGATLSTDEAIDRYKKGDYSGAVLGTIEAALNAASMAPPTSPAGLMTKGVGTVGSLGMIPIWIAHDYFGNKGPWAPKKEPQKARGGLTLMR
jgi:hypothetical protein